MIIHTKGHKTMQKLKDGSVYLMGNGAVVRIPQVFTNDHNLTVNKEIEIHRETLPDGRDALIIIPKKSVENHDQSERADDAREVKSALEADVKMV